MGGRNHGGERWEKADLGDLGIGIRQGAVDRARGACGQRGIERLKRRRAVPDPA